MFFVGVGLIYHIDVSQVRVLSSLCIFSEGFFHGLSIGFGGLVCVMVVMLPATSLFQ